jgi:signal transduction histidine kinase
MGRLRQIVSRRSFWILTAMLVALAAFHYLTPQVRFLHIALHPLGRHAVERIIFILPVAGAAFAFGQAGGLVALVLSILIMLPRVLFLSPYPGDALTETVAVGVVGYLVVWMIETQEREKQLRQEAVLRLRTISAVTEEITSELELDRILPKVIQIANGLVGADGGFIALFDQESNLVSYPYLHNLPQTLTEVTAPEEQGLAWDVMAKGHPAVIDDYAAYPRAISAFVQAGVTSAVAVPIVSGEQSFGTLALVNLGRARAFSEQDVTVLASVGRQAGIAIDNARLYENMRFYARQITRAQEAERERIAREMHDETIQTLILISRRLEALGALSEQSPTAAAEELASLQELITRATGGMRRFIRDLRPSTLDHLGFVAAVEGLAGELMEENGIDTRVTVTGEILHLASEEELVLFRIAQEALSNVRRHSGAKQATVQVEFLQHRVRVTVRDDGHGFDAPTRMDDLVSLGKLGLIGMHERVRTLGGTLAVQSAPGEGTTVAVDVPLQVIHDVGGDVDPARTASLSEGD